MIRTDIMLAKYIKKRLNQLIESGCFNTEESYFAIQDIIEFLDSVLDGEKK